MPRKKNHSPSNERGHARNAGQRAVPQEPAEAPAWVPELEKWEQAPYDGIKGFPPEWVPEPHRKQFGTASRQLFFDIERKNATYAEIRSRFDDLVETKHGALILALTNDTKPYDDDLRYLVKLYRLHSLGNIEEGLRQLAGEYAVAGFRVRTGYKKREDFSDRPEVQRIAKEQWAANPKATFKEIIYSSKLKQFQDKYNERTLWNWLRAVDPRPLDAKQGRPRSRKD